MKLLCPAYSAAFLDACVCAAIAGHGHDLAVIINPDSGPGLRRDEGIAKAMQTLSSHGVELWLYLDALAGEGYSRTMVLPGKFAQREKPGANPKTIAQLGTEAAWYRSLYCSTGGVKFTGFFVDDVTETSHLTTAVKALAPSKLMINPGNPEDARTLDSLGKAHAIVWWEQPRFAIEKPKSPLKQAKGAVLALNEPNYNTTILHAWRGTGGTENAYVLATDINQLNPWKAAPTHFRRQIALIG